MPKIGLVLPMFCGDPARVLGVAREAEALGFDGVFGSDHLFPMGGPPDGPALECFTTLSAVAAVTERVAVGTLVARVGLRTAGMLGKLAAGLDHVSGGRAILGVGTGDRFSDEEHRRYGFPVEPAADRMERLTETVVALRALFRGELYRGGRLVPPLEGPLVPAAVQEGGPPIWIGGTSDAVVRVAARTGQAWNGWGLSAGAFERRVQLLVEGAVAEAAGTAEATWGGVVVVGEDRTDAERLGAERAARGREPAAFTGSADDLAGHLRTLADAGATWTVLLLPGPPDRRALVAEALSLTA